MAHDGKTRTHRYWFSVSLPEIGLRTQQGWAFGTSTLDAARSVVRAISAADPQRGAFVLANDVHVTHDTACNCLPPELRHY